MTDDIFHYFNLKDPFKKNVLYFRNERKDEILPEDIFSVSNNHNTFVFLNLRVSEKLFKNAKIRIRTIIFSNCDFEKTPLFNVENSTIILQNSITTGSKKEFGIKINGNLNSLIFQKSRIGQIYLNKLNSKNLIFNSSRQDKIFIGEKCSINKLKILNMRTEAEEEFVTDRIDIYNPSINEIDLQLLGKLRVLRLYNIKAEKVKISGGEISQAFYLDIIQSNDVSISNFYKCKWFYITTREETNSEENYFIDKIELKNIFSEKLDFHNSKNSSINQLNVINCSSIKFNNLKLKSLKLIEELSGECKIKNSTVNSLYLENFRTTNFFELNNVNFREEKTLLSIKNSILDNTNISPSFLHQIHSITFEKSSLGNLKINNFIGINDSIISQYKKEKSTDYLDLFRELKSISEREKNQYLIQKFKALEYNELLNDKRQNLELGDWLILNLNKLSNNHTTNPWYSFGWMIILNLIFGTIIGISLYLNEIQFSTNQVFKNISYFFNPLKLLNEYKIQLHGFVYILEFVYKISIGYLIYQFISSFRKFNK